MVQQSTSEQKVLQKMSSSANQLLNQNLDALGYIQFFHLSSSSKMIDIFINGVKIYKQISYKQLTNKLALPASSYHIDIYPTDVMVSSLLSRKIEVLPGTLHNIALSGEANDMKYTDTPTSIAIPNSLNAKFIHLVADGPSFKPVILAPKSEELPLIQYKQSSKWMNLSPSMLQGCIYGYPYRDYLTSFRFPLQPQKQHLIYIFGSVTGDPPLELMVLIQ
ncbi:DUF4397 domain-containing protein [Cytobacillus kochii]|uniref:DUF4397 domain-containing protein n=1 Tax=Cytobacillus kochii TaxID=859143 RepID=UPI001CD28064|nr:DUF4397 domain-containing protein [Cytobacillus kochii]MCA1027240.1 DUF4397 domain-containing protein [Cytobacillus kochii]